MDLTEPVYRFSLPATTFTPAMAKRNSAGPFAAGVLAQGQKDGTGLDVVSLSRGALVIGAAFYANFDANQGNFVTWWTAEYSSGGIATGLHYFFYASSTYYFAYDYSNARYELKIGNQALTVASAVVAGTTYNPTAAWDIKNWIDGTNYARVSINDVHTFGITTAPTLAAPDATMYFGSNGTGGAMCALLEGTCIFRRVLWDGAYGVNVGNGDEINLIYAAGAGADPCTITGSWDVCLCVPTNSTPGALVTGTGEAWSAPHSSNVITSADGFMSNGVAWTNWIIEGSPINPALITVTEKIFAWGYQYESDAANEGYKWTLAGLVAGKDYVLRAIGHSDGTSQPRVVVYDETNGAQITALSGTITSTKIAPNVLLLSFELPTIARGAGVNCTSISIKLINIATSGVTRWHQCELYSNLLDNPSLDTGAVANPWIPYGWTNGDLDAGDSEIEIVIRHSEGACMQANVGAASNESIYQNIAQAAGKFYSFGSWLYASAVSLKERMKSASIATALLQYSTTLNSVTPSVTTTWQHVQSVFRAVTANPAGQFTFLDAGPNERYTDDAYIIALNDVTLSVTPASAANSLEGTGIRIDGNDLLVQVIPTGMLFASYGNIEFYFTPRHGDAIVALLGVLTPCIAEFRYNAANTIVLDWSAANTLRLRVLSAGVTYTGTWATGGGAILAGTKYKCEISYHMGNYLVKIDGTTRVALGGVLNLAGAPATAYWGSGAAPVYNSDIMISAG
jgi:hypothetical protein